MLHTYRFITVILFAQRGFDFIARCDILVQKCNDDRLHHGQRDKRKQQGQVYKAPL